MSLYITSTLGTWWDFGLSMWKKLQYCPISAWNDLNLTIWIFENIINFAKIQVGRNLFSACRQDRCITFKKTSAFRDQLLISVTCCTLLSSRGVKCYIIIKLPFSWSPLQKRKECDTYLILWVEFKWPPLILVAHWRRLEIEVKLDRGMKIFSSVTNSNDIEDNAKQNNTVSVQENILRTNLLFLPFCNDVANY
jgi:hypothetical protein